MISSTHRFHGRTSLRAVYQRGQVVRGPKMGLRYLKTDRPKGYRAAVIVSRKVDKSAVARNRIRRRVYAQLTEAAESFTGPYDLVFTAFDAQLSYIPATELQKLTWDLLKKSQILKTAATEKAHDIVEKAKKEE